LAVDALEGGRGGSAIGRCGTGIDQCVRVRGLRQRSPSSHNCGARVALGQKSEVDPVSWTPDRLGPRSPRNRVNFRLTEQNANLGSTRLPWQIHSNSESLGLAFIGPHDEHDVFERDDQDDGPEHQRQDPEHRRFSARVRRLQRLAKCIDRTGSNIAENHPKRTDPVKLRGRGAQRSRGSRRPERTWSSLAA
jgi:hypothetical protein